MIQLFTVWETRNRMFSGEECVFDTGSSIEKSSQSYKRLSLVFCMKLLRSIWKVKTDFLVLSVLLFSLRDKSYPAFETSPELTKSFISFMSREPEDVPVT